MVYTSSIKVGDPHALHSWEVLRGSVGNYRTRVLRVPDLNPKP